MQVEQTEQQAAQQQRPRELIKPTSVGYTASDFEPTMKDGKVTKFGRWFAQNMLWPKPNHDNLNGDHVETLLALLTICQELNEKRLDDVPESKVKPPKGCRYLPWPLVGFLPYGKDRQTGAEGWILVVIMARGERNGWNPTNCYDSYRAKNLAYMVALDGSAYRIPSDNLSWCRAGSSTLNLTRMHHATLEDEGDGERSLNIRPIGKTLAEFGWSTDDNIKVKNVSQVTAAMHPYADVRRILELLPTEFCTANFAVVSATGVPKEPVEGETAAAPKKGSKKKSVEKKAKSSSKEKSKKKKRDASPKRVSASSQPTAVNPLLANAALVEQAKAQLQAQIALGEELNRKLQEQQAKNKKLDKKKSKKNKRKDKKSEKAKNKSKKDKKKKSKSSKKSSKHHKKHRKSSSSSSSSSSSDDENLEEASGSELEFYDSLFGDDCSFDDSSDDEDSSSSSSSSSE